jgi:hypothetical protein
MEVSFYLLHSKSRDICLDRHVLYDLSITQEINFFKKNQKVAKEREKIHHLRIKKHTGLGAKWK